MKRHGLAERILEAVRRQTRAKRNNLVLRLPIGAHGVAANGKALPNLPGSMVHILVNSRRTGPATMTKALSVRQSTPWVVVGSENVTFKVSKSRNVTRDE